MLFSNCFFEHRRHALEALDARKARVLQVDPTAAPWAQVRVGVYVTDGR